MKKLLLVVAFSLFSFTLMSSSAQAASFEDMKEHVQSGEGAIFNPISEEIMTEDDALDYIEFIESKQENLNTTEVLPEVNIAAFEAVTDPEDIQSSDIFDDITASMIQPFGAHVPTQFYDLVGPIYPSNGFSGSGWRYSGFHFRFRDYAANPYFGVRAEKDSFYFNNRRNGDNRGLARYVIPANGQFLYYSSSFNGYTLNGFFSTLDPVSGSRYFIY
ncbi:hypothetical protein [Candidatus Enterococcus clewellii]|uniref:Uncharacterized protein n=1 Tax=Candidatus Enterococcus clewellii TaxID=1834193 RepID=A0AAQ3VSL7_9ENTE